MPDLSNDRESEAASLAWATDLMTHHTRRTWWVPLLAVPLAQVVTAAEVSTFLLLDPDELTEAREWAGVVLDQVREESTQEWSPRAALAAANLTTIYSMALTQVFGLEWTAARFLDLPDDLAGEGLITRLGQVLGERPEPPAWLAVVALPLLEDPAVGRRRRELLPQPESFFAPVTRALDRRCYELGFRAWADAARHSAEVWTAERWRGTLIACTSAIVPEVLSWVLDRALPRNAASGPSAPSTRRPRPDRRAAFGPRIGRRPRSVGRGEAGGSGGPRRGRGRQFARGGTDSEPGSHPRPGEGTRGPREGDGREAAGTREPPSTPAAPTPAGASRLPRTVPYSTPA